MIGKEVLIFLSLFLLLRFNVSANASKSIWKNSESSFNRIDSLNELAFEVKRNDVEKAMRLLYQALSLAEKYNYQRGIAVSRLYEAGIYQQNGFAKKALVLYYKSLQLSRSIKDTLNIARAKQQLGNLKAEGGKLEEAEGLYMNAISNYRALSESDDVANVKNSIGLIKLQQGRLHEAEKYFREALRESDGINYYYGHKKAIYNLGLLFLKKRNFSEAKRYFQNSLALDNKKNDKYGQALTETKLAEIAQKEGNYQDGIKMAKSAYLKARSISAMKISIEAIHRICSIYDSQRKQDSVISWQNELIGEQERLTEKEKNYALNFVEILNDQYNEQIKAEKAAALATSRSSYITQILVIVCVCSIVFIVLTYFWHREYKKVKVYSKELSDKNLVIEQNIISLNRLNSAISKQNGVLEESNRMKDKLLSIVSHDLRQPLASTKGVMELINSSDLSPEETKDLLNALEGQYVRSLSLLDNLLFWIKGQMNGETIKRIDINLKLVIETVILEIEQTFKNKGIAIQNELKEDLWISGDKEMLKVIFRNLLSNAAKFTANGWIKVNATIGADEISIHVQDSGMGMDPKTIQKVKEKVYFTTRGTNMESGRGFGLMICSDLIQKHNGKLSIESEPGRGSTFTVTFSERSVKHPVLIQSSQSV